MDFITGAELLAYVAGTTTPAADDAAWADDVALAVNAAVSRALDWPDPSVWPIPVDAVADLHVACLAIGAERMKRREAPFGIAGYDVSGGAVRLSADDLMAGRTAIARWGYTASVGVG